MTSSRVTLWRQLSPKLFPALFQEHFLSSQSCQGHLPTAGATATGYPGFAWGQSTEPRAREGTGRSCLTWGGWACGIKGHSSPDTVTSIPVYALGPTVRPGDGEGDVDIPFVLISFLFLKLSLHQGTLQSLFGKIWLSLNAGGILAESSFYVLKMMTQWNSDRVKKQQKQTPSGAKSFVSYLILAK